MWAMRNFPRFEDFFIAAKQIGFSQVELNHQVSSQMLSGVDLSRHRFSSIHEPCPADIPVEILRERDWLISALDPQSREQGVASIKRSIDLAVRLGAGLVVIHAGNVRGNQELEQRVSSLYKSGLGGTPEFLEASGQLADDRRRRIAPRLESAIKSLGELVEYAGRLNIQLGLENRYHYLDIPGLDEMEILLELAGPDRLGFVFDVGHAQALDRLGFYRFEGWLKRYADRMVAVHLHDVIGIRDHLAPGLGEVDFNRVAVYLPKAALRTVEVQAGNTRAQVKEGLRILADKGCVKRLSM